MVGIGVRPRVWATIAVVWLSFVEPAASQEKARGELLAQSLCANCHLGGSSSDKTGRTGVPTFAAIANRPTQTFEGVVSWLRSVPSVMPNHRLSQDEILDLAAFIVSLQEQQ